MQFGDGKVVDFLCESLICGDAQGLLHLSKDRAEMGDSDDVMVGVKLHNPLNGSADAAGHVIPAFAAGGANITGIIPKGAQMLLIWNGIKRLKFPVSEMDFAQVWIMGQA